MRKKKEKEGRKRRKKGKTTTLKLKIPECRIYEFGERAKQAKNVKVRVYPRFPSHIYIIPQREKTNYVVTNRFPLF